LYAQLDNFRFLSGSGEALEATHYEAASHEVAKLRRAEQTA